MREKQEPNVKPPHSMHTGDIPVRMAEDDCVCVREPSPQPLQAPLRRPRVVDHGEDDVLQLEGEGLRQLVAQLLAVDVPVDRGDGAEGAEISEHRALAEVAGVDDQVRGAEDIETGIGEAAVAAREVRVGDQGEPGQSRSRSRSERSRAASIRSR
jgi:hypothetical protein